MSKHHHEGKSYMARRNLYDIYKNTKKLLNMVKEGETLDDWMEHKISTARNAVSDVASAFEYEKTFDSCGCDDNNETPVHMMRDEPDQIITKVVKFGEWLSKKYGNSKI